ncbi:MAG: carbohydrate ABC transporter permease [Streptosporangiaceae bacterium]
MAGTQADGAGGLMRSPSRSRRRRPTATARRNARVGLALVSPALLLVGVFTLFPLGFGVYISLTNWPLVGSYHFIGMANYQSLIHNTLFVQSVVFTLEYTAIVTVPILVVGYGLAVLVRSNSRGAALFRTLIFLPFIVGLTTESYMAVVEFQPSSGTANFVLSRLGIVKDTTAWLVHTGLAMTAICVLVVWFASGLTMMLLMAGMQGIPAELYESARVDGASWWTTERWLTLPLLRRSIALSLIISVIGSLLAFNQFYIMTMGGPGTSTTSVVMSIVNTGFTQFDVGLASAMSVVLVIVVGLISFAQFHLLQRGEDLWPRCAAAVTGRTAPARPGIWRGEPPAAALVAGLAARAGAGTAGACCTWSRAWASPRCS